MNDSDLSTGFSFTSHLGDDPRPGVGVTGFNMLFDFDIPVFRNITALKFTWTGIQNDPSSSSFSDKLWIQDEPGYPGVILDTPDGQLVSGQSTFTFGGGYGKELANVIHDDIASI
jgi:hypothetical protein